jgi:hypothetical protein
MNVLSYRLFKQLEGLPYDAINGVPSYSYNPSFIYKGPSPNFIQIYYNEHLGHIVWFRIPTYMCSSLIRKRYIPNRYRVSISYNNGLFSIIDSKKLTRRHPINKRNVDCWHLLDIVMAKELRAYRKTFGL